LKYIDFVSLGSRYIGKGGLTSEIFSIWSFCQKSEKVEGSYLAKFVMKINEQKISDIKLPLAGNQLVMTKSFDIDQNF
jgi:hypothetical protein